MDSICISDVFVVEVLDDLFPRNMLRPIASFLNECMGIHSLLQQFHQLLKNRIWNQEQQPFQRPKLVLLNKAEHLLYGQDCCVPFHPSDVDDLCPPSSQHATGCRSNNSRHLDIRSQMARVFMEHT